MKRIQKPKLEKPIINGSVDEWGYILNDNIDKTTAFIDEVIQDSTEKENELSRLEQDKISRVELPVFVKDTVDNYIESEVKPNLNNSLDEHVESVNKPDLDSYTAQKKKELDTHEKLKETELNNFTDVKKEDLNSHVEIVNKPELTRFTESQKPIIQGYTEEGKQAITAHTEIKKGELDTKTNELLVEQKKQLGIESGKLLETQKSELDKHEQSKEIELNNYVNNTSKVDIDNFTDTQKTELNDYVDTTNKPELDRYTESKKTIIDGYSNEAKIEITNHTNTKKSELDSYTVEKKGEITAHTTAMKQELTEKTNADKGILDGYTADKKEEITSHTSTKLGELDSKTEENKGVLDSYEKTKEQEISSFVDTTVKPDITKHADIEKEKSTTAITSHTNAEIERINASTDLDAKLDKVDVIDDLTTTDPKKALSANQGNVLYNMIKAISGGAGTIDLLAKTARATGRLTYSGTLSQNTTAISVGSRLYESELFLDGTRMDDSQYNIDLNTGAITLLKPYADYNVTWVVLDKLPYRIAFSFPTIQQLLLTTDRFKTNISIGDVIEIEGENEANDGEARLVIVGNTKGLNGVELTSGKWLNEIPNTRISNKLDKGNYVGTAQDLKSLIDTKLDNSSIVNDLTTGGINKPLSAEMGKVLDSQLNKSFKSRGMLPRFDGTIGGFEKVVKNGIYSIAPDNLTDLGINIRQYGSMVCSVDGVRIDYTISLENGQIFKFSYPATEGTRPESPVTYTQSVVTKNKNNIVDNVSQLNIDGGNITGILIHQPPKSMSYARGVYYKSRETNKYVAGIGKLHHASPVDNLFMAFAEEDDINGERIHDARNGISYKNNDNLYVRGQQVYSNLNCPIQKSANGYHKLPNGLIIQWGEVITSYSPSLRHDFENVQFPVSFSNGCVPKVSCQTYYISGAWHSAVGVIRNLDIRKFSVSIFSNDNTPTVSSLAWIAIGY